MKVNNKNAGHIIVEVLTKGGWVVLDPFYNLYFKNPSGGLASFKDVSFNWSFYKTQVPANYNFDYNYEYARYTNWRKIPVIMPLIKKFLNLTIGEKKADEISLRVYFLSMSKSYSNALFVLIILLSAYIIVLKKKKFIGASFKHLGMVKISKTN